MSNKLDAMYHDWEENFIINFHTNPEKYEQLLKAKARGKTIKIIIAVKWWSREILSSNLFLEN